MAKSKAKGTVERCKVKAVVNMTQGRAPYEVCEIHIQGFGWKDVVYQMTGPGITRRASGYHEIAELQALLNIAYAEGEKSKRAKKGTR